VQISADDSMGAGSARTRCRFGDRGVHQHLAWTGKNDPRGLCIGSLWSFVVVAGVTAELHS
jgi:hypothetical protein